MMMVMTINNDCADETPQEYIVVCYCLLLLLLQATGRQNRDGSNMQGPRNKVTSDKKKHAKREDLCPCSSEFVQEFAPVCIQLHSA